MINVELLQKTLDTIKANPQHWNQANWHCGTSHCFAGFAELIANEVPITTDEKALENDSRFYDEDAQNTWRTCDNAMELLGLSGGDTHELFYAWNTLEDLEAIVSKLIKKAERLGADG